MAYKAPLETCKVYTPARLAHAMIGAIRQGDRQRWLEPSLGKGVFLEALHNVGVPTQKIMAVDIEKKRSRADVYGNTIRGKDFLAWSASERHRFDCVVGNPPFIPIRTLPKRMQLSAASVLDRDGNSVGVGANTWYAFILRCIALLRDRGQLAFVLPAACEFADYCRTGRDSITGQFERVDLIRSRRSLFKGVAEGAAVIVCRNKGGVGRLFRRHEVDGLQEVVQRLNELSKFNARPCPNNRYHHSSSTIEFGEIAQIGLGGVTGDTRYFTMTEDRRLELGLPLRAMRPVLSRSRHVRMPIADAHAFEELKLIGERIWLFDPTPALASSDSAVRSYLRRRAGKGGCRRDAYKVRIRRPWYRTPMPLRPDAFISGMSMSGVWMCLNDSSRLNATNTLYVVRFRSEESREKRFEWSLALCTTYVRRQLRRQYRVYAAGLRKIEPGQLSKIVLPRVSSLAHAQEIYAEAVQYLLSGDESTCERIANTALGV